MKKIFKDKKRKLVAIILTFAIVALSIFNVNIIQGNNEEVILPNTLEQAEALADTEITITTYFYLSIVYNNGVYTYVCIMVTYVSICNS
jgi:hypothetical protein